MGLKKSNHFGTKVSNFSPLFNLGLKKSTEPRSQIWDPCLTWVSRNQTFLNKGLKFNSLVRPGTQGIKYSPNQDLKFESLFQHGTQEIKLFRNQGLKFESLVQPGTQEINWTNVSNLSLLFDLRLKKSNQTFRNQGLKYKSLATLDSRNQTFFEPRSQIWVHCSTWDSLIWFLTKDSRNDTFCYLHGVKKEQHFPLTKYSRNHSFRSAVITILKSMLEKMPYFLWISWHLERVVGTLFILTLLCITKSIYK